MSDEDADYNYLDYDMTVTMPVDFWMDICACKELAHKWKEHGGYIDEGPSVLNEKRAAKRKQETT